MTKELEIYPSNIDLFNRCLTPYPLCKLLNACFLCLTLSGRGVLLEKGQPFNLMVG